MTRPTQRDIIDNRNIQPIVQEIKDKMDLIPDNELIITLLEKIEEVEKDTEQFTKKGESAEITGTFTFTTPPIVGTPAQTGNPVPLGYLSNLLDNYTQKQKAESITGAWYFTNGISGKSGTQANDYATVSQIISPAKDDLQFTGSNVKFTQPVKGAEGVEDTHFTTKSQVADKGKATDTIHAIEHIYNVYYHQTPAKTVMRTDSQGHITPEKTDIPNVEYLENFVSGAIPELSGYLSKIETSAVQTVQGPIDFTKDINFKKNVTFGIDGTDSTVTFNKPLKIPGGSELYNVHFTGEKPYYKDGTNEDPFITKTDLSTILSSYTGKITYANDPENPRTYQPMDLVPKQYVYDIMNANKYVPDNVAIKVNDNKFTANNIFEKIPTIQGTYTKDSSGHEIYTFPVPFTKVVDVASNMAESSIITDHYLKSNYYDKGILDNQFLRFNGIDAETKHKKIDEVINFNQGIEIKGAAISEAPSYAWEIIGKVLVTALGLTIPVGGITWYLIKRSTEGPPVISDLDTQKGVAFNAVDVSTLTKLENGVTTTLFEGCPIPPIPNGEDYKGQFAPFYSEQRKTGGEGAGDGTIKLVAGMGGYDYLTQENYYLNWHSDIYSRLSGPRFVAEYNKVADSRPDNVKIDILTMIPNYIGELGPISTLIPHTIDNITAQRLTGTHTDGPDIYKYSYLFYGIGHEFQPIFYKNYSNFTARYLIEKAVLHAVVEPSTDYKMNPGFANFPYASWSDYTIAIGLIKGRQNDKYAGKFDNPDLFSWAALYTNHIANELTYHNLSTASIDRLTFPDMNIPANVMIGNFEYEPTKEIPPIKYGKTSGCALYQKLLLNNISSGEKHKKCVSTTTNECGFCETDIFCEMPVGHQWQWPDMSIVGSYSDTRFIHNDEDENPDFWYQSYRLQTSLNTLTTRKPETQGMYTQSGVLAIFEEKHNCNCRSKDIYHVPTLPFSTELSLGYFAAKEIMRPRIAECCGLKYVLEADDDYIGIDGYLKRNALNLMLGYMESQPLDKVEGNAKDKYASVLIEGWPVLALNQKHETTINTAEQSGILIKATGKAPGPMPNEEIISNSNELTDESSTVYMLHNIGSYVPYSARAYYYLDDGSQTPIMGFSAVPDPCQENLPLLQLEATDINECRIDHPPKAKINCNLDVKENIRAKIPDPLPDIQLIDDGLVPVMKYIKPIAKNAKDAIDTVTELLPLKPKATILNNIADKLGDKADKLSNISTILANPLTDYGEKKRLDTLKNVADAFLKHNDDTNFLEYLLKQLFTISPFDHNYIVDLLVSTLQTMANRIIVGGEEKYVFEILFNQLKNIVDSYVRQNDAIEILVDRLKIKSPTEPDKSPEWGVWDYVKAAGKFVVKVVEGYILARYGFKPFFLDNNGNTQPNNRLIMIDENGWARFTTALFMKNITWMEQNGTTMPVYDDEEIAFKVGPQSLDSADQTIKEVASYVSTNINLPDNDKFEVWSQRQKTSNDSIPLFSITNTVTTNGENVVENNTAVMGTVLISNTKDNKQDSDDITDSGKFFATHAYVESHGSFYKVTDSALYNRKQLAIIPSNSTSENTIKTILTYPESITGGVQGGIAVYNSTTNHKAQLRLKTYKTNNVEKSEILFVDHNNNEHPITINTITVMPDVQKRLNLNDEDIKGYKIVGEENVLSTVGNGILMTHYYILKNGKKVKAWSGPVQ